MAGPIVGPISETVYNNIDGSGSFFRSRVKYKQAAPFDQPLPYLRDEVKTDSARLVGGYPGFGGMANASSYRYPELMVVNRDMLASHGSQVADATNSARARFVSKMSQTAEVLVNLAEREQAMSMITHRLMQVANLIKAVRQRRWSDVPYIVGAATQDPRYRHFTEKRKAVTNAKQFANTWLEFHFGWSPLVNDIGNMINVLDGDIPYGVISVTGKRVPIGWQWYHPINGTIEWQEGNYHGNVSVRISSQVRVDNPNLFLASRLGLTNPAAVAWELVPYSFVVDWFVNVGDYLQQFSEFHGVTLINPYHTIYTRMQGRGAKWFHPSPDYWRGFELFTSGNRTVRNLGIPSVSLGPRPGWFLSPSRALTAASLVIQRLRG